MDDPGEFDTALELCCHGHRRIVLAVLVRERRALTLNDLTKEIVTHNHHAAITDVPSETVNRIYLSLCHYHVPKLLDAGIVTHDRERQLVEPTDRLDRLRPHLSTIIEADPDLDFSGTDCSSH